MEVRRLEQVIRTWRDASPDDVALIVDDTSITVGQFADTVDAFAVQVAARTAPGERVAVLSPNSVEFVALLYAVPAAGRVLVPLNIRHTTAEIVAQLDRSHARVIFGTDAELGRVALDMDSSAAGTPNRIVPVSLDGNSAAFALEDFLAAEPSAEVPVRNAAPRAVPGQPDDVAWIIFTSGTTGQPKGVLLTHAGLLAGVGTTAAGRPLADDDVYLYPFPLYHVSAYNVLHAHLRRRPVVLLPRFDAATLIDLVQRHRVTSMSLAPTMIRMLLDELTTQHGATLPSLRTINYGAAALPEALLREAVGILGCSFAQGYGMTELSGNAVFLSPADHRRGLDGETRFLHAAGYPGVGVRLRLVDESGREVASGEAGEVTVAADQVCAGYLDDPTATAATIVDGWLHTGDVGVCDDDGLLHIVDRAKDVVVTGGENVSSQEVEAALLRHVAVAQAAVIGLPDDRWGEAVTAVIVVRDNPAARTAQAEASSLGDNPLETLRRHVGEFLAGYKKPRRVEIVDSLPINAGGKIDKQALRKRFT